MTIQEINSNSDNESLYNSQNCQTKDWEYTAQWLSIEFDSHSLLLCQQDSIWESRCWHHWREDKYDEWQYSQIQWTRYCQTVNQWQKSRQMNTSWIFVSWDCLCICIRDKSSKHFHANRDETSHNCEWDWQAQWDSVIRESWFDYCQSNSHE